MRRLRLVAGLGASALSLVLVACSSAGPASSGEPSGTTGSDPGFQATDDGITLTSSSPERLTGVFRDKLGDTIAFDLAKVNDDLYVDVTGNAGRPILHIETSGEDYNFSYMGGGLTLHTTKTFVSQARTQAQANPSAVSTSGFAFSGDMTVLDDLQKLPEVAQLPTLSRALGVRGITGSDYPASLVLHKIALQSAQTIGKPVAQLTPKASVGYCDAYPNQGDDCYGMCGPGCSCWSWICGDCCYHYGCAVHDSWCRDGEWWWCYNITAVIALFGC
jgi:hypothetical protein